MIAIWAQLLATALDLASNVRSANLARRAPLALLIYPAARESCCLNADSSAGSASLSKPYTSKQYEICYDKNGSTQAPITETANNSEQPSVNTLAVAIPASLLPVSLRLGDEMAKRESPTAFECAPFGILDLLGFVGGDQLVQQA